MRRLILTLLLFAAAYACHKKSPVEPDQTRVIALSGSLSFGTILVGSSGSSIMRIANTGTGPLHVTSLTMPTGYTSTYGGSDVIAGGFINAEIIFRPTAGQSYNSTIVVNCDSTSGSNTIGVTGSGITLCQQNNSADVAFENHTSGATAITMDIIFDGSNVATVPPGGTSETITITVGAHVLRFENASTHALACGQSTPTFVQCESSVFFCPG